MMIYLNKENMSSSMSEKGKIHISLNFTATYFSILFHPSFIFLSAVELSDIFDPLDCENRREKPSCDIHIFASSARIVASMSKRLMFGVAVDYLKVRHINILERD